jgi:hypothetical protein
MATGRVPTTANSPLTAKGDLFGYSTTQARVAVGNDGETLVADSSTSTGLRYQGNFAAGKNKIINGDFGVWQRGTSFSNALFSSDRWRTNQDGNGTQTVTQQTFTPGTAPIAGYEGQFFLRNTTSVVGTSTYQEIQQRIEDVRTLAGQTATVSFWAKADSSRTATLFLEQNFGSGGSGSVYPILSQSVSLTSSWQRFTFTVSVASISGKTIGTNSFLAFFIRFPAATSAVCDLWGVQIEASNTATAFQTATGTIQGELSAAQRYYYRTTSSGDNYIFGLGQCYSTTAGASVIPFPVPMRIRPTALEQSGTAGDYKVYTAAGVAQAVSAVPTFAAIVTSQFQACVNFTVAANLVAGNATQLAGANASAYLGWSAEL